MTTPAEQWFSDIRAKKRAEQELADLKAAARVVVEAWDSDNLWKKHIDALRAAVEAAD